MYRKTLFLLAFLPLFILSCTEKDKENELAKREKTLLEKEQFFAAKENEFQALIKMRDSLYQKEDSVINKSWPEMITGVWSGKTICIESNCPEYAIGDVRSEFWDFTAEGQKLISKVSNNGVLIRTYTGDYTENKIFLDFKTDSTSKKQVEMSIVLDDIKPYKIKGTRLISVDNKCSAKFNIELLRSTK